MSQEIKKVMMYGSEFCKSDRPVIGPYSNMTIGKI